MMLVHPEIIDFNYSRKLCIMHNLRYVESPDMHSTSIDSGSISAIDLSSSTYDKIFLHCVESTDRKDADSCVDCTV